MTAFITKEIEDGAVGLGARRVRPRPFDRDERDSLVLQLRRALRRRRQFDVAPPYERVM